MTAFNTPSALFETLATNLTCADRTCVLGLCGPQGSGKSTLAHAFARWLREERRLSAVVVSLDDLYLSRGAREDLARRVHPLLRTRGVPGTHDVAAGVALLARLTSAAADDVTHIPRFDKARDEPSPADGAETVRGQPDVVIFEGWCVGARAQGEAALSAPINALEREEDADGRWRRWVNAQLATHYPALFAAIDRLVLLAPAGFEPVLGWRREQERALVASLEAGSAAGERRTMNDAALSRFVMHYERLTRHILQEMPERVDVVVSLNDDRRILSVRPRG